MQIISMQCALNIKSLVQMFKTFFLTLSSLILLSLIALFALNYLDKYLEMGKKIFLESDTINVTIALSSH